MRAHHRTAPWAALLGVILLGAACDWNDPDELNNSSNFAVVKAQFFASSTSLTPVSGVRMIIEAPEEADRPYNGPDVVAISGEDGIAVARVFPGFTEVSTGGGAGGGGTGGGTGGTTTGPTSPLDLPPPLVFADVAVTLIYNGEIRSLISGGLTVGSGKMYDLGTVYLDGLLLEAD